MIRERRKTTCIVSCPKLSDKNTRNYYDIGKEREIAYRHVRIEAKMPRSESKHSNQNKVQKLPLFGSSLNDSGSSVRNKANTNDVSNPLEKKRINIFKECDEKYRNIISTKYDRIFVDDYFEKRWDMRICVQNFTTKRIPEVCVQNCLNKDHQILPKKIPHKKVMWEPKGGLNLIPDITQILFGELDASMHKFGKFKRGTNGRKKEVKYLFYNLKQAVYNFKSIGQILSDSRIVDGMILSSYSCNTFVTSLDTRNGSVGKSDSLFHDSDCVMDDIDLREKVRQIVRVSKKKLSVPSIPQTNGYPLKSLYFKSEDTKIELDISTADIAKINSRKPTTIKTIKEFRKNAISSANIETLKCILLTGCTINRTKMRRYSYEGFLSNQSVSPRMYEKRYARMILDRKRINPKTHHIAVSRAVMKFIYYRLHGLIDKYKHQTNTKQSNRSKSLKLYDDLLMRTYKRIITPTKACKYLKKKTILYNTFNWKIHFEHQKICSSFSNWDVSFCKNVDLKGLNSNSDIDKIMDKLTIPYIHYERFGTNEMAVSIKGELLHLLQRSRDLARDDYTNVFKKGDAPQEITNECIASTDKKPENLCIFESRKEDDFIQKETENRIDKSDSTENLMNVRDMIKKPSHSDVPKKKAKKKKMKQKKQKHKKTKKKRLRSCPRSTDLVLEESHIEQIEINASDKNIDIQYKNDTSDKDEKNDSNDVSLKDNCRHEHTSPNFEQNEDTTPHNNFVENHLDQKIDDLNEVGEFVDSYDVPDVSVNFTNDNNNTNSHSFSNLILLCAEKFLENECEVVASLASGNWNCSDYSLDMNTSNSSEVIKFTVCDCPLVDESAIDVELPGQIGICVVRLSELQVKNTDNVQDLNTNTKQIIRDMVKLTSIGRYQMIHLQMIADVPINGCISSSLVLLQNSLIRQKGSRQYFSFEISTEKDLPRRIASKALDEDLNKIKNYSWVEKYALCCQTQDKARFLRFVAPSLSVYGTLSLAYCLEIETSLSGNNIWEKLYNALKNEEYSKLIDILKKNDIDDVTTLNLQQLQKSLLL